ncbi:MAG: mandelate racemase/muconate lactonizing enzyme family protein [Hyphomicrobiales bacterium]|nr:mandelate racemase/muconate lactonizing enzyme family protein [Hyphomicrobiales bacterium]
MTSVELVRVEAVAYRVPIEKPIKVAFGAFRDRPFVLVRVVDKSGAEGFGEAWCNWPSVGAEHRARLVVDLGERLIGRRFGSPTDLFDTLSRDLETLVLQTGEVGPIAQAVSGIDIAVNDLVARRQDLPLYRALGGAPVDSVPVYATGIDPDEPEQVAVEQRLRGHRAFKLKTGFGHDLDVRNLRAMREALGPGATIMTDANQGLRPDAALAFVRAIDGLDLAWLEEPLRVDAPAADWRTLARASTTPLAGGENLRGGELDAACRDDVLRFIQPDATKWGGVSGTIRVARAAVAHGKAYCPHVFGGGVNAIASLHLLAAAGGGGTLEYDWRPNPARECVVSDLLRVEDGRVAVPSAPGLGIAPDLAALDRYRTWPQRPA